MKQHLQSAIVRRNQTGAQITPGIVQTSRQNLLIVNPISAGGGQICPHHHVFAYTRVCMRIHVLIFCDFSSFWVCKRVQQVWPQKNLPFSQEPKKLVQFAQLS